MTEDIQIVDKMKNFLNYISETKIPDSKDLETSEVDKLEIASKKDKAEYSGRKGKHAHHMLHKTLDAFIKKMRSMGHK